VIDILKSKEFANRLWVIVFLLMSFVLPNPWKFVSMLFSGIVAGLYNGYYNDIIWRPNNEKKLEMLPYYRAHQVWIHIFCGSAGSFALYYLTLIDFSSPSLVLEKYGFNVFVLSFITVMGYIGLLPRLLWYTSYGLGQFGKPLGK